MEPDQWKDIWQRIEPDAQPDNEGAIKELLQKKSAGSVAKMKRNLNMELWMILIGYGGMILFYFRAFNGRLNEISWYLLFVALLFILYYIRKSKLLNEIDCVNCQVKTNLQKQVHTLEKYVRFYLIAGTVLVPISFGFFFWILHVDQPNSPTQPLLNPGSESPVWKSIMLWLSIALITTVLLFFLNKWYIQKLYGRHILKLKAVLDDMRDDDD